MAACRIDGRFVRPCDYEGSEELRCRRIDEEIDWQFVCTYIAVSARGGKCWLGLWYVMWTFVVVPDISIYITYFSRRGYVNVSRKRWQNDTPSIPKCKISQKWSNILGRRGYISLHFDTNDTHLVAQTSGFRSHMSVIQDVSFGMSLAQGTPFCQSKTKVE